jgi:hypothetical protein
MMPASGGSGVATNAMLTVSVSNPNGGPMSVVFYGRAAATNSAPGPDFSLVALPDTQMYTAQINGGTVSMFTSQTDWIINNRVASNIVYVTGEGDISNDGDTAGYEFEWQNATNALYRLGDPALTGLADGIPCGVVVGNHDLMGGGALIWFNQYLGTSYFQGRGYYGGHYGADNANHYDLFSAGGMDFIALSLKMGAGSDSGIMAWANAVLQANANRRAIVITHSLINPAAWPTPGAWTAEGPAIFNGLTNNPNLFLMMCGHMHGEGRRHEAVGNHYVDLLLADWQAGVGGSNGGDGYLRILQFSPANNQIRVSSYSPYANQSLTDADSQFTLDYTMAAAQAPFVCLGTNTAVASGTQTSMAWPDLAANTTYEWYAVVSDGSVSMAGATNQFTTLPAGVSAPAISCSGSIPVVIGAADTGTNVTFSVTATDACDPSPVVISTPAGGSFFAPGTNLVTSVATDSSGNSNTCSFLVLVDRVPVAANTPLGVTENQAGTFAVAKLLSMCSDADNDPLTISSVGPASNGTVTLDATNITYTPAANYVGGDAFNYVISDGRGGTATGVVSVMVTSASAPSLNIASPPTIIGGHFQVGFAGIPGISYTMQFSSNVNGPWTTVTNITAPEGGVFEFVDPVPAAGNGFYRTTSP